MLVTLENLNVASPDDCLAELAGIFERTPWIAQAVCAKRPFPTLAALLQSMIDAVRSADADRQKLLIKAHPDLGAKAGRAVALTAASKTEQAAARLDQLSNTELERFHRFNAAYQSKFDMPFVLCVRRHSKESILRQFERRLQNARDAEIEEALIEIFRIAALRLADHVIAPDQLKVHGLLSTHVLDTSRGRPAEGVAVELVALSGADEIQILAKGKTNAGGRTNRPLMEKQPLPIGRYELRFSVAEYFARQGGGGDLSFLDVIPVRFAIAEPEAHYHIPLLATPWSYATYRGS